LSADLAIQEREDLTNEFIATFQFTLPANVIDDDAALREALQSLIRSVGLSVATFASAREFITSQRPVVYL
jgi:hypothetical protein